MRPPSVFSTTVFITTCHPAEGFQAAEINALIVPRPHLSVNGRQDPLTPPAEVEKIRDYLLPHYRKYGKESDCHIELFDCAHVELPEMRMLALQLMDHFLMEVDLHRARERGQWLPARAYVRRVCKCAP